VINGYIAVVLRLPCGFPVVFAVFRGILRLSCGYLAVFAVFGNLSAVIVRGLCG
jgi:hypothetical protein